jgi:hypothetical protein
MTPNSLLQLPLTLRANTWQLLGISHVYPYLKASTLTVSVDGTILANGPLAYPVVENNVVMQYSSLFTNLGSGGVIVNPPTTKEEGEDERTPASQLSSSTQKDVRRAATLKWQVATIALYPDFIEPEYLQILSTAGVALSLQHEGRVILPLPPTPNSTKGSALDGSGGPSVGIPLSVHPLALQVQQRISRVVLYVTATRAQVLKTRIVCPFVLHGGHYDGTPKVGLMQPSIPLTVEAAIHFVGSCKVMHSLSNYLLESSCLQHLLVEEFSSCASVVLQEQSLLSILALPFFLSLPPALPEMQMPLKEYSLQQLYALYAHDATWAAQLLELLVISLQYQGGRLEEECCQHGILIILSTTLRRSLVRAQQLKVWEFETYDEFRNSLLVTTPSLELEIHSATAPKRIPIKIAQACTQLVEVCCGTCISAHANKIRRESDLALTCVFGLALDFDLWGVDYEAATLVLSAVSQRYGGTNVLRGNILRNQIPVQSLLDQIRIRLEGLTKELEDVANSLANILTSMLLSSLSNKRNITNAEHDITTCIGALSDCPLGTVGAHVILVALSHILQWCDIIPMEHPEVLGDDVNDDDKLQVATRLGRNLLMGQYHDVVAPMLLSRTVFCGERVLAQSDAPHLWQYHWRLSLLLFVVSLI